MALLNIHRSSGINPSTIAAWDPFRTMREFLNWEPFQAFDRVTVPEPQKMAYYPHFEVREGPDAFIFKADLPGVKESDLEITLLGDRLSVSGKRESEVLQNGEIYYTFERNYGTFTRTFTLPSGWDDTAVRAELKEGVLTIVMPKKPEIQPKRIALKAEKVRA